LLSLQTAVLRIAGELLLRHRGVELVSLDELPSCGNLSAEALYHQGGGSHLTRRQSLQAVHAKPSTNLGQRGLEMFGEVRELTADEVIYGQVGNEQWQAEQVTRQ
jgi:hypothetical protein